MQKFIQLPNSTNYINPAQILRIETYVSATEPEKVLAFVIMYNGIIRDLPVELFKDLLPDTI